MAGAAEEFEVVKTHAVVGAHILSGGQSELLQLAEQIAFTHHERWDGAGYPDALAGAAIPLTARIFAVADTLDALTTDRPYRPGSTFPAARAVITRGAESQFDPEVVAALDRVPDAELASISEQHA